MVAVKQSADELIEAAIGELRRNRQRITDLMPCSVTIHLPPPGSADRPCLEINAKLRPGLSCGP